MPKAAMYCTEGLKAEKHEALIQEAVTAVHEKRYLSIAMACCKLGLTKYYHTVNQHFLGKMKPHVKAHMCQQLLNSLQEKVLQNWIKWLRATGIPLSKCTIAPKVEQLCG
ncbi:uncharacterized protein F5147DRAFT_647324 [Suillus discolor]|uniref:Uncharacterized protein n=1 Tax=Suillus discolor TaxID=1912936 RepID=A0A9P7K0R1_9AGAM|nr:uncharacterized protein F5147DRAFT_647324 [Suillus discolor]KAG2120947.1 hypothetical protein F5147DRAFT_647324 [Suillus discolor]